MWPQGAHAVAPRSSAHASACKAVSCRQPDQQRRARACTSNPRITAATVRAAARQDRLQLAKEARAELANQLPPDLTIICGSRGSMHAHRAVLQLASVHFKIQLNRPHNRGAAEVTVSAAGHDKDVMETLVCRLYPIHPKPELSWDNIEGICDLAFDWGVACELRSCEEFLLNNLFAERHSRGPAHQCEVDELDILEETTLARKWLMLSDKWGLTAVTQLCMEQLVDLTSVVKRRELVADGWLSKLSVPTLRKVVDGVLSQQGVQYEQAVLKEVITLMVNDCDGPSSTTLQMVLQKLGAPST